MTTTRLFFLIVLVFTSACSINTNEQEDCIDKNKINPEAICTKEFKPVCGCNGKTYGNKCAAEAEGLTSWTEGPCPEKP